MQRAPLRMDHFDTSRLVSTRVTDHQWTTDTCSGPWHGQQRSEALEVFGCDPIDLTKGAPVSNLTASAEILGPWRWPQLQKRSRWLGPRPSP